jgi:hypothetical protein
MKLPRPRRSLRAYVLRLIGAALPARLLLRWNKGQ